MDIKKSTIYFLFLFCFMASTSAHAADFNINVGDTVYEQRYEYNKIWEQNGQMEQKVLEVGFRLLNENKIRQRVHFRIIKKGDEPNANALYLNSTVSIYSAIFPYIDNDDELAAVMAHEITHILQYKGFWNWFIRTLDLIPSQSDEYDADLGGVDLMVRAGYNPLAMISFQNKLFDENHWFWNFLMGVWGVEKTHPDGSKRLLKVYTHILIYYPSYIAKGYDNIYYKNFLMDSENNKEIQKIKDKYKL